MVTKYPSSIDDSNSLPKVSDNSSPIQSSVYNTLRDTIVEVEKELGVKPSGKYTTVRHRLDMLEELLNSINAISLAGDLGGSTISPKVTGFQGNPVDPTAPLPNQVLVWNGVAWTPQNQSGSVIFGQDLSGINGSQTVVGLQNRPVSSTAPSNNQVLAWDGYKWTPTNPGGGVAFTVNLNSLVTIAEVNQTINTPAFNASYNLTVDSATLTDSDNVSPQTLANPFTSFNSIYNFTKNSFGDVVTFTLNATSSTQNSSGTATITWGQRLYWGTSTIPGSYNESFIENYLSSQVTTSVNKTFTVTAGSLDKIYFACRSAYGTPTFTVGGFEGGFFLAASGVSVTNAYGFTENYDIYESDNVGLGLTTVVVS